MNLKITLKLPPRGKTAAYLQIYYIFFFFWFIDVLHLPTTITYLTDVLTVFLLLTKIIQIKNSIKISRATAPFAIFCLIFLSMLFGAAINFVKPLLVLWGIRNNVRFFLFFFICIGVFNVSDIERLLKFVNVMLWLNVIYSTFQFFVQGLRNDYLGGFFGTQQGCNAYTNVMLCFVAAYYISAYLNKKIKIYMMAAGLIACMYLASITEIKFFYFEFLVIFVVALLVNRPTLRSVGFVAVGTIAIVVGFFLLSKYNPDSVSVLLDESSRDSYLNNSYSTGDDLSRMTAVHELYVKFFSTDRVKALFGFGIGNCDTSRFTFLQSAFFNKYEYLHYRWFSHAWVYLEQGAVGLILLIAFLVSIFICTIRMKSSEHPELRAASAAFVCTCLVGLVYNCSLEIETSYLIAFFCSIPFILKKDETLKKHISAN